MILAYTLLLVKIVQVKRHRIYYHGFIPANNSETQILENLKKELTFDPCLKSHQLRETSFKEPEKIRNAKVILEQLTNNNYYREAQCWEETNLNLLRQRGNETGLTDYLKKIEERLILIFIQ